MKKQNFAVVSSLSRPAWKHRVIASTRSLSLSKWCVAISFSLFFTACGDETTTNVTETTGMYVVKKGDKTPDCTADNEGEMIYVADSAAAFFCADGKWQSLKGEKGDKGEQGEKGEKGDAGDDGVGTKGEPGAAGESCTAQKLASGDGYKIVCGGDSVGVVVNGESVASGKDFEDSYMIDHRDFHIYKIVVIGGQTWMAENLKYNTDKAPTYCYGESETEQERNCAIYGRLYTWAGAIGKTEADCGMGKECNLGSGVIQGICPLGWHLPNETEFRELFDVAGGIFSAAPKLMSVSGWADDDGKVSALDTYGFSALPGGSWDTVTDMHLFIGIGSYANFWSTKAYDKNSAYGVILHNMDEYVSYGYSNKSDAYSVRCVKDSE